MIWLALQEKSQTATAIFVVVGNISVVIRKPRRKQRRKSLIAGQLIGVSTTTEFLSPFFNDGKRRHNYSCYCPFGRSCETILTTPYSVAIWRQSVLPSQNRDGKSVRHRIKTEFFLSQNRLKLICSYQIDLYQLDILMVIQIRHKHPSTLSLPRHTQTET